LSSSFIPNAAGAPRSATWRDLRAGMPSAGRERANGLVLAAVFLPHGRNFFRGRAGKKKIFRKSPAGGAACLRLRNK